ncbi:YihD family protein [Shewanella sp. A3A]|uniref:YihD family protein n=1 Tax=Shewanella electrica TaxID=515560 RepID=A0ABT2FK70_9GAMM|nr:YihD family protein [Shewanella electrica]MCH1918852.1 YihD family protein [Shewanella ferrihydritica]MCH1924852.1 YihD family protein [Shewanella electrica]MCS4556702.1 YihD family protein [Shewanella electrica]
MSSHRINELLDMLNPAWQKDPNLNLVQFLQKLADEAGFKGNLSELSDDVLIYQLKMRDMDSSAPIPGIQKDYVADFKTEILRARGMLDE